MASEILIGKYGRKSPINSLKKISLDFNLKHHWKYLGVIGALAGVLILSYYSVFAGIAFSYMFNIFPPGLENPSNYSTEYFSNFAASPLKLIFWHSLFMIITCIIVGYGVIKGIGRSVSLLMPILFLFILFSLGSNSIFNIIKIYQPIKSVGTGILTGIIVGIFIAFT